MNTFDNSHKGLRVVTGMCKFSKYVSFYNYFVGSVACLNVSFYTPTGLSTINHL